MRSGDEPLCVIAGSIKASVAFFSSAGVCYTARIADIPATTGHGVALQTLFKLGDGERIIAALSFDKRFLEVPQRSENAEEPEPPLAAAVTKLGMGMRFSLRGFRDPSNRAGRKFARLKEMDEVVMVAAIEPKDHVASVSQNGRALICSVDDLALLAGAGRGVITVKLKPDDALLGAKVLRSKKDTLKVTRDSGGSCVIGLEKYEVVSRGGKGFALFKRGKVEGIEQQTPELPEFPAQD
jgi:DNA gyrase subunit A